jgi:hypothetical protein
MSRAVPISPSRWFAGFVPTAKQLSVWLISILVVAFASAYMASYFTRQDNLELAFKQQQLSDIQKFQAGAGALDTSFRSFNDSLVDHKGVEAAREAMRAAIAQHSSDTYSLQRVFGAEASTKYIDGLARLRRQVDETTDPTNAMPMAQTAVNLIGERQAMVKSAEARLGNRK